MEKSKPSRIRITVSEEKVQEYFTLIDAGCEDVKRRLRDYLESERFEREASQLIALEIIGLLERAGVAVDRKYSPGNVEA